MRRALVWAAALALSGLAVSAAFAHTGRTIARSSTLGYDISWPQCSGDAASHLPSGAPPYVILGLTDGIGHTVNPCLGSQLAWASSHGVRTGAYLVASYPSTLQRRVAKTGLFGACSTTLCRLQNDGAAQAIDAVNEMRAVGLHSPRIWIDVEFRHSYSWTHHNAANAAVIQGIVRGLKHEHVPMGVYTTSYMWHAIVGNYTLDVPNWLPVGHGNGKRALAMCGTTATGGATWMVQYTRALDLDLTCPVLDPVQGVHGKLWKFRKITLHLLSAGPAVRAVQRKIGRPVTGQYGALTSLAVRRWQASKGLPRTGQITRPDWRALGAFRRHGGHAYWLSKIARAA